MTSIPELPDNKTGRFLSLEILLSLLMTAAMVGVAWGQISSEVSKTDEKVVKNQAAIEQLKNSAIEIQTDVALIKQDQQYVKIQMTETKEQLKEILNILQQQRAARN